MPDAAFAIAVQLFDYDRSLPLNARILDKVDSALFTREKFVFSGWRNSRVPGLLARPHNATANPPVVLLIDGIDGWKERWWQKDSWSRGRVLIDSLLASGFAVVMADAPGAGERRGEGDFENPSALLRANVRLREMLQQATIEHRRLIDYLGARGDVDTTRIGVLGLSMGGMIGFYLAAAEPRVRALVTGLTPLRNLPDVLWPGHYAPHSRIPVLMLMGRTDAWYDHATAEAVQATLPRGSRLHWYDVGHRVPEEYAGEAVRWLRASLGAR